MKKGLRRILSAFLVVLMLLPSALTFTAFAQDSTQETQSQATGATFAKNVTYTTSRVLENTPLAFEATVKLPAGYTGRPGVIFGNYAQSGVPCISFELNSNCKPRLYCISTTTKNVIVNETFNTSLPTGEDVHVAVTINDSKALLYINGVLKETKSINSESFI